VTNYGLSHCYSHSISSKFLRNPWAECALLRRRTRNGIKIEWQRKG